MQTLLEEYEEAFEANDPENRLWGSQDDQNNMQRHDQRDDYDLPSELDTELDFHTGARI